MRLAPRTFFGRNALLLLGLFIFVLLCGGLTLRLWLQTPRMSELAELVARQVRLAQVNLELVPDSQRASMRPWINSRAGVVILPVSAVDPPTATSALAIAREFVDDLKFRLPDALDVRWTPIDHGTVWVRTRLGREQYWVIENGIFLAGAISRVGIGILLLIGALSVSGAALIQRRINRPLAHLVESARALAAGKPVAPLAEEGPEEFAVVSRAFNQMTSTLAKANAERAVLLAGVSHDVRTPLAKIRLAIEMLSGKDNAPLLESMLRSTAEMEAVTDQFLYYAREEDRNEFIDTDLNAVVMESVDRHCRGTRSIHARLQLGRSLSLHPESLRRAIDNLIENAIRYSDQDIDVETHYEDHAARVSVLDRGPGIPTSEMQTLKMPFVRGSASVGIPGTGLGLAIVERIVRAHGGSFTLLPRDGGGLEARIDLPYQPSVQ